MEEVESAPSRKSEQDIYEDWESIFGKLTNCLAHDDYLGMVPLLEECLSSLRMVINKKGCLHHRASPIIKKFLQEGYLSEVVKVILNAFRAQVQPGYD